MSSSSIKQSEGEAGGAHHGTAASASASAATAAPPAGTAPNAQDLIPAAAAPLATTQAGDPAAEPPLFECDEYSFTTVGSSASSQDSSYRACVDPTHDEIFRLTRVHLGELDKLARKLMAGWEGYVSYSTKEIASDGAYGTKELHAKTKKLRELLDAVDAPRPSQKERGE
ncbi:uncharacterized protein SRS1_16486 [Sporisorium reilianum f. sp. reilianum]|uniref:Uncharacterized protein n=1 Tax=Sporisorium reilianum f. sp. reilianum TaxID=72559 RepID=A0A2N8UMG6_9BASI|nr:uncharacterized protein SRS1_16486 [Sporisorium reilianum f. sp. reilianum]